MATEKKDYIDIIEAVTAVATPTLTRNKLNKVRARTEDRRLQLLLDSAIRLLDESGVRATVSLKLTKPEYGKLHSYCEAVVTSSKPQWQILAEQNGWGPPHAKA